MNVFSFTGNLGRDAERKSTAQGTALLSFPVAIKSGYGDNEKTSWAVCQIWGKRAEGKLGDYLVKGQQVAVTGELVMDEWQDKDGGKRSTLKVNVNNLDLTGGRSTQSSGQQQNAAPAPDAGYDSDVPF